MHADGIRENRPGHQWHSHSTVCEDSGDCRPAQHKNSLCQRGFGWGHANCKTPGKLHAFVSTLNHNSVCRLLKG